MSKFFPFNLHSIPGGFNNPWHPAEPCTSFWNTKCCGECARPPSRPAAGHARLQRQRQGHLPQVLRCAADPRCLSWGQTFSYYTNHLEIQNSPKVSQLKTSDWRSEVVRVKKWFGRYSLCCDRTPMPRRWSRTSPLWSRRTRRRRRARGGAVSTCIACLPLCLCQEERFAQIFAQQHLNDANFSCSASTTPEQQSAEQDIQCCTGNYNGGGQKEQHFSCLWSTLEWHQGPAKTPWGPRQSNLGSQQDCWHCLKLVKDIHSPTHISLVHVKSMLIAHI